MRKRLLSFSYALSLFTSFAATDHAHAQATERPPAPARGEKAAAGEASPIESFDLQRALASETGGLTADESGRRARARSPQIASANAAAEVAAWDAKTQWTGFVPQMQLFGQYKRISNVNNNLGSSMPMQEPPMLSPAAQEAFNALLPYLTSSSVNFTQPLDNYALGATVRVPVSDMFLRIWPSYQAAKGFQDAQELQAEATANAVDVQARSAFYQYATALAVKAVREQAIKQREAQAAQIKLFVDAGTRAAVELVEAKARLEEAKSDLASAEGNVQVARARLATLTGIPEQEVGPIAEPITEIPSAPTQAPDALVRRAHEKRPELLAFRKLLEANGQRTSAERNAALPQLYLEGNTLYANPNPRYVPPDKKFHATWDVSANLVWTPNNAITGHQRSKRVDAESAKTRADLANFEDNVRVEVIQAYVAYQTAAAAARSAEEQQRAAEEAYRVRLAMYRVGTGVTRDLIDADLLVNQARLAHVVAVLQARTAMAQLNQAAMLNE